MPKFLCFGSPSSQDSDDKTKTNYYPKRRRFSLTRSLSFSGTLPTKNTRSVSSFFKKIRKSGSKKSSTGSSSLNTEEDYGSSWTYYPIGHVVRVDGVDFEIVSPPCVRAPTASGSGSYQPSSQPFESLTSTSPEPSESSGSGSGLIEVSYADIDVCYNSVRRLFLDTELLSTSGPGKARLASSSLSRQPPEIFRDSFKEIMKSVSPFPFDSQRVVLITAQVGTYYRAGSIYGQMMGIDAAMDALMKQEIHSINPKHPLLVRGGVSSPLLTGAMLESAIGDDSENLDPKYFKLKHRIRRKPAPAF